MRLSLLVLAAATALSACSSVTVKKLDAAHPGGVPFYLTKPMVKTTTTTYAFFMENALSRGPFRTEIQEEKEIVNVTDTQAGYTINHTRPFAGESKFAVEMTDGTMISKASTEDKEGVTEFLKGLVEGAKTLTELAKEAAEAGAGAPAGLTEHESQYFQTLAGKGVIATKRVDVTFSELQ